MLDWNKTGKLLALPLLGAAAMGFLMLPGALRLRGSKYRRMSVDGVSAANVVTIEDAIAACRRSGLQGWELVTFAQQLVTRKFATYSTLNLWDPPGRAFIFGTGYCTQYNLALRQILDGLGFETETVFALNVRVLDNDDWTMGHTWLHVTVDGATKDVCAGSVVNEPGRVNFFPLSTVHQGRGPNLFLTHLGLILFMGFLEWKALLTRTEPPSWAYKERQ